MAIIKPEQLSSGTYNISGSFSGSFHGDGSDLNNLPLNVLSYSSYANFPSTGSEGYIYIDNSANIGYLWDSGSIPPTYVNIAGPSTPPDVLPLTFANAATVLALSPSPLYNNGISGSGAVLTGSINGTLSDNSNPGKIDYVYTPIVGDVILVKNQPTGSQNGLYTITSTGSVSSKYVLTRTDEYDVSSELFPLQVNILAGTNNNNKSFIQSTANPVIGTSSLVFSAASPATSFSPQIAFVDTVIDTPLTNIVYATGSFSTLVPGNGATLTSTVTGSLGTWNGLSVNTNSKITGSFTKVLVINQTNPAHNGDYSVITTGSAAVFWQLQRINNNASGFDRYTRFFLVSNTSSSKAGRMYFTRPNSPVLTNATIGTAPINIFEYGGGGSSTPAFPFTGSALITGSLGVTGSLSVIGSSSIDLVRITQTGTGNAFVVEDSTNPDSTPFVITNAGNVGIGTTTPLALLDVNGNVKIGLSTTASGTYSHAEGYFTFASGSYSHAEGNGTRAIGVASHAEGQETQAIGYGSHAEGYANLASGSYSHAEGTYTTSSGYSSHAEGQLTIASGSYSHAEGINTTASGIYSHAEGNNTVASGLAAHAEGGSNLASGIYSHAEGGTTIATGTGSHAEGATTIASGNWSHAEGIYTTASGNYSHAEGQSTQALGFASHTEGFNTVASGSYQHVQGQFNLSSSIQSAFILGNGTSDSARSNLIFAAGSTVQITGSLNVSGSITGSLQGTASYALSASYAPSIYGPFGISNLSGSYTYYNTLSSSMAAASSGQTIEVFADYTESAGSSVTLKNGVNINGNGHTYIGTGGFAGRWLFQTGDGVTLSCSIINYNITLTQGSPGSCLYLGTNTSGVITLTGTVLKATGSSAISCLTNNTANSNFEIIDFVGFCSTNQSCISWGSSSSGKLRNAYASATTGSGYTGNVRVDNSIFTSVSGIGLSNSSGIVSDSIGISAGSYGIQSIGGLLNNSKGYSSGGVGIYVLYSNAYNCFGYSTSTYGMQFDNEPCRGYNCFGYSTANNGIRMYRFGTGADVEIYNSTAISTAATAFYWEGFASNMTCISEYNNVNGHAAEGANNEIIANSTLNVKHTGSNCLFKSTPVTQKYTQCTFKTATTPVNANITQGMINTQDNQGNIII